MKRTKLYSYLIGLLCPFGLLAQTNDENDKMQWFNDAKFGMFIHYGVYSTLEGEFVGTDLNGKVYTPQSPKQLTWGGEWIMNFAKIPRETYKTYAHNFTAKEFDAKAIANLAQKAGMKYIVLTIKHHEGFLLYPSQHTSWCISNSGAKERDLLREFLTATKEAGLKAGIYFSQNMDWMEYGGMGEIPEIGFNWYPKDAVDQYVTKTCNILDEILTNYGKSIDLLWWDIPSATNNKEYGDRFMKTLLNNPNYNDRIIQNNRMSPFHPGDYDTPEQQMETDHDRPFELCSSVTPSWGYSRFSQQRNFLTNLDNMLQAISRGGNFLLNIPPRSEGNFDKHSMDILNEFNSYMDKYGESIYSTEANGMIYGQDFGRITRKGNTLFLHKYIKDVDVELTGVKGNIISATLDGVPISYKTTSNGYKFPRVPSYSVIKVVFDQLTIDEGKMLDTTNREITLTAMAAKTFNCMLLNTAGKGNAVISFNKDCKWKIRVKNAGYYSIYAHIATTRQDHTDIQIGDKTITFKYPKTGGIEHFQEIKVGDIYLPAGSSEVSLIRTSDTENLYLKNLRITGNETTSHITELTEKKIQITLSPDNRCIQIKSNHHFEYQIYTLDGILRVQGNGIDQIQVPTNEIQSSICIVKVKQKEETFSKKLLVRNFH